MQIMDSEPEGRHIRAHGPVYTSRTQQRPRSLVVESAATPPGQVLDPPINRKIKSDPVYDRGFQSFRVICAGTIYAFLNLGVTGHSRFAYEIRDNLDFFCGRLHKPLFQPEGLEQCRKHEVLANLPEL